jgi:hypothetical protein
MMREAQIDTLANFLVQGLIARGAIKPKADVKDLVACVVEMMSANFDEEARIEDEAATMAEELARKDPRADVTVLRNKLRQRIAEKRNFPL